MGLTAEQAAEIALRHGLDIDAAVSLRALADDEATADKIAARFAPNNTPAALAEAVIARRKGQA